MPDICLWSDHPCWYPFSIGYCLTSDCGLIIAVDIHFLLVIVWHPIVVWSSLLVSFLLVIVWHLIVVWSSLLISFFYWLLPDIWSWSDHPDLFSIGYCLTSDCGLIIPVGILVLLVIVWHLIVVWSSLLVSFLVHLDQMNDHWNVLYRVSVFYADRKSKMATTAGHRFNIGPYGKMFKCLLLRNYKYD